MVSLPAMMISLESPQSQSFFSAGVNLLVDGESRRYDMMSGSSGVIFLRCSTCSPL